MNPASTPTPGPSRPWWRWALLIVEIPLVRLRFIVILLAIGLVIGSWETIKNHWEKWSRPAAGATAAGGFDTEYYCPMHPTVVRPGLDPGGAIPKCPICNMPLSKRKKGEQATLPAGVTARAQFSPERIQMAGIRTEPVSYRSLMREIRTVGFVQFDESRLAKIVSRVDGYVEKLHVAKTWVTVSENQPLAEIYSPVLYSTVQELLLATKNKNESYVESARERLRLRGIRDPEIDEIVQSGRANHLLLIRSPLAGHVIAKPVVHRDRVTEGMTLFEIADLSIVWIEANVYEKDIPFLRVGLPIEATVDALPGRTFRGNVTLVHPHLESATRTNQVRFEIENPTHELRPGMFATVRITTPVAEIEPFRSQRRFSRPDVSRPSSAAQPDPAYFTCPMHPSVVSDQPGRCTECSMPLESHALGDNERLDWWCPMHPTVTADRAGSRCDECKGMKLVPRVRQVPRAGEVLAVPARAVIDTGSKKIVYFESAPGQFDGVEVELGPRAGGYYPVVKGLDAGMRVAAAGAFLIDAETRLSPGAAAAYFGATGGPQAARAGATPTGPTADGRGVGAVSQPRPAGAGTPFASNGGGNTPPHQLSVEELANIDKLPASDRVAARVQALCPISEQPLGSMGMPYKLLLGDRAVFLCCKGCESEARREANAVLRKLPPPQKPEPRTDKPQAERP